MWKWILIGITAASLLASTAYAAQTQATTQASPAKHHAASVTRVAQQKDLSGNDGPGAWEPLPTRNAKVWHEKQSKRVFQEYPWAPISPLAMSKK